MVNIYSSSRYKISKKEIRAIVELLYKKHAIDDSYVLNVVFVGKIKMRSIAKTYKREDEALPILAFPYLKENMMGEEKVLGELFICYPQAVVMAAHRNKKVGDILAWLIDHGFTNLLK